MRISTAALAVVCLTFPPIAFTQPRRYLQRSGAYDAAGRVMPIKMLATVSMERISEPGVYDDVILAHGYPDNYAAAREIAEYASEKYKRDYRVKTVQP